jgi:hypothetical protein
VFFSLKIEGNAFKNGFSENIFALFDTSLYQLYQVYQLFPWYSMGQYKQQSPIFSYQALCRFICTDSGKIIEHIYGFLMVVERILQKYDEKNSEKKNE